VSRTVFKLPDGYARLHAKTHLGKFDGPVAVLHA
jgi:hypothetical protein